MSTSNEGIPNIHKTNVQKVRQEIADLFDDLIKINYIPKKKERHNDPDDNILTELKEKYSTLFTTSSTLFKLIVNNYNKSNEKDKLLQKIN